MRHEQQAMEQPGNGHNGSGGAGFNIFMLVLRSITVTVEVFLHRRFGSRFLGLQAALGILVILLFAGIIPAPGSWGLILFLLAYLKACLVARAGIVWRRVRGEEFEHTLYSGQPWLMKVFPRLNELTIKRVIEPMAVFVVAAAIMNFIPALGLYLLMAAIALGISVNHTEGEERRRAQMMNDAVIDAQQRAERFRSMSGRR